MSKMYNAPHPVDRTALQRKLSATYLRLRSPYLLLLV
jgi:hypothetical protein